MIIAIPVSEGSLDSAVDPRFGRAKNFLLYDTDSGAHECIENRQNLSAAQGAGIQSASLLVNRGAKALIAPNVGPKAHAVLAKAGVRIFSPGEGDLTARQAIERYASGSLQELTEANVEGHW